MQENRNGTQSLASPPPAATSPTLSPGELLALDDVEVGRSQPLVCDVPMRTKPAHGHALMQTDAPAGSGPDYVDAGERQRRHARRRVTALVVFGTILIGSTIGITGLVQSRSAAIEHGTVTAEASAQQTLRQLHSLRPKLLPWFQGQTTASHDAYCFAVHPEPAAAWIAYAWPAGDDGHNRRAFSIDASGRLFAEANRDLHYQGAHGPDANAALPQAGSLRDAAAYLGGNGRRWTLVR